MAIAEHYDEAMDVLEQVLVSTFDALNANHRADLSAVASQYPFTPVAYRSGPLSRPAFLCARQPPSPRSWPRERLQAIQVQPAAVVRRSDRPPR
eukprot:133216-Rhodomonas_salina.2